MWKLTALVLLSIEPWAVAKKFLVSVAVPPAPVRVPSQRPLAPSVASVTSVANDKGFLLQHCALSVILLPSVA